jgi:hypothetical protein
VCVLWLCRWLNVLAICSAGAALGPVWQSGPGFRFVPLEVPADGQPGFSLLLPAQTGIVFTNALAVPKMMENHNLMNGSGVAAGDFDGDGWCGLYFCAIDGTNALYRNLGGWRFEDVTAAAGVGLPGLHSTGAVFADINGDGRLDLLVATLGSGVHCFLNQGGGRFRESTAEAGLASETGSTSLALADVNGDGSLDLYVANYGARSLFRSGGSMQVRMENGKWVVLGPNANRLRYVNGQVEELGEAGVLYLNDGRGHFRPVPWDSDYFVDEDGRPVPAPLDFALTVVMRDINGHGCPDIYICNDFAMPDHLWLNDGTGHFRALPRLAMRKQSHSSMGVDFADIGRDGYLDFMTTEMTAREHGRQMREMASLRPQVPVPGRIEDRPSVPRNALFHNRGDGTYVEMAYASGVAASDWTWQPVFLDVDLDGYEDLLIGNGMWFDVQDRDSLSRIRSMRGQTVEQSRTNLAFYPSFVTSTVAYRNRRDLTFEDMSRAWGFDAKRVAQGIALADLDHDGGLDVVINCLNSGPLVYRNRASAPRVVVRLRGKSPNVQGIGARIRVLGGPVPAQMQEILCGGRYLSGDDPMRVFAAGTLTNRLTIEVLWRSGRKSTIADARANCLYEVDEAGAEPAPVPAPVPATPQPLFRDVSQLLGHTHHEEFFPDYGRQPLLMKQFSQLGPGAAWLDLDQDGHDELVLGSGKGGAVLIYHRDASGRFIPMPFNRPLPLPDDLCGLAAWVTADGHPAILAAQANYESDPPGSNAVLSCSLAGASGRLDAAPLEGVAAWADSPGPVAVADMDGDGNLELFVGGRSRRGDYPEAASSRIFRHEGGRLVPDSANNKVLEHVGLVSGAVWSDLDGDGFPELILACEWGPVRVFKNEHGHLREETAALGLAGLTGWWSGVTTGDLDEDGRLDIIAANWGLNDVYQATPEHPLRLYYGDLTGSGTTDLIETYFAPELNADVPRRTLNALSQAVPELMAHFPTHLAFSAATASQVLECLPRKAQVVTACTLKTTLFLNRGDHFEAVALPAEAQWAPAFAVNVADADGDGHEDVFLSQNFFAVRPELGRLDGGRGLWLRGDGKGGLVPMPGQESGVEVYGEQRGAALGDFDEDGRVDLVVTQNGAATRLFQNVGARPGLRVRLKGPPGNPFGIGGIIRLQFGARLGPAREVHAGSGYWSQDGLVQVLGCPEPPSKIQVLWPGGSLTRNDVPPGSREVTIDTQGNLTVTQPAPQTPKR